jgi:hypothetical protein
MHPSRTGTIVRRYLKRSGLVDRRRPRVEFRAARTPDQLTKGWCEADSRRVVIYRHWLWDRIEEEITLVHELVHLSGVPGTWDHRRAFRLELARAARRVWGINVRGEDHRSVRELERAIWWAVLRKRVSGAVRDLVEIIENAGGTP